MSDIASHITKAVGHLKKKEYQPAAQILNNIVPLSDKPQSHDALIGKLDDVVENVLNNEQLPIQIRGIVILMNVSKVWFVTTTTTTTTTNI
jgi:hypothetical protein